MDLAPEMTPAHAPFPGWIETLAQLVAASMLPVDPLAPVGCHAARVDDTWEISVFVSNTEIVGGSHDGRLHASRFELDLMPLMCLFSEIDACTWQTGACGRSDELGAHLAITGLYADERICLRILKRSPRRFPPGRRIDVNERTCLELWN